MRSLLKNLLNKIVTSSGSNSDEEEDDEDHVIYYQPPTEDTNKKQQKEEFHKMLKEVYEFVITKKQKPPKTPKPSKTFLSPVAAHYKNQVNNTPSLLFN